MAEFAGTDRFQILRRLGSGATGVVYLAHDRQRAVDVALKTLAHVDAHRIAALKNEFRALSDVVHPNLVTLHELFFDEGEWFFTMEPIEGASLIEHVRREPTGLSRLFARFRSPSAGPAPTGRASAPAAKVPLACHEPRLRAALRQLAEAVAALHAAGKLHRDIKPSNTLVTAAGRLVLLDFGLSVMRAARRSEPTTGERPAEGTPAYMAPEQTKGAPPQATSDWYSVGVILYEALTGQLPFRGGIVEMLASKRLADPPRPSRAARDVPEDLDQLCVELLDRDPERRPGGDELLRRLGVPPRAIAALPAQSPVVDPSAPFIGRDAELGALRGAFARARGGEAVVVHVRGPSGMGKTALVQRFLDEVWRREGALVLSGRCYERENVPYKAWDSVVDALVQHLGALPEAEVESLVPPGVHDLGRVFPVLHALDAATVSGDGQSSGAAQAESRARAFGALKVLLARLAATRPLVLHIDDLQWGDVDSANLLLRVLAPPDAPALLFIGSYRSGEAGELLGVLGRAAAAHAPLLVEVGRLPRDEAELLARAQLGATSAAAVFAATIARESEGSPFFVEELVREVRDARGPTTTGGSPRRVTLEAVLRDRIGRLPAAAHRLLELCAVAARPVEEQIVGGAAEVRDGGEALAALRAGRLVRVRPSRGGDLVETAHDRIRDVVLGGLDATTLRAHHLSLARAFEARPEPDVEALVGHFEGAGERESAARYAARAAALAEGALAFERAARLYRLALDAVATDEARAPLLAALGEVARHAGPSAA